jgi:hypothetical protein
MGIFWESDAKVVEAVETAEVEAPQQEKGSPVYRERRLHNMGQETTRVH